MKRLPVEERKFTVSTAMPLKHITALESHARAHGLYVSEFIRAAIQAQLAPGGQDSLILNDIDPELFHALEQQAAKLGKDIAGAAKDLLTNACRPVA
jgi:hypothetical protein